MCVVPHEGGTPEEDGGELGADDASAVSANDDAAAYGGGTENGSGSGKNAAHDEDGGVTRSAEKDAAMPGETAGSTKGSSGGCSMAAGSMGSVWLPIGFAGLGLALVRRRRARRG